MMGWLEYPADDARKSPAMLLNLGNMLSIHRGADGEAIAATITGAMVALPVLYDTLEADMFADDGAPLPGAGK